MSKANLLQQEYIIVKLKGKSKWYINGFRSEYDGTYPKELEGYISEPDFRVIMDRLNLLTDTYWACDPSYYSGLILSPVTLGLSFLIPFYQIHTDMVVFLEDLKRITNLPMMREKSITFTYRRTCFNSYIEIKFPKSS